jgi:hypothetical protein
MSKKCPGVRYVRNSKSWSATIKVFNKPYYLGLYLSEEDAARAISTFKASLDPKLAGTQRKRGTSEYRGVSWCQKKKKWKVVIQHKLCRTYIGHYDTEEDAALAYNEASLRIKGKEGLLNVIKKRCAQDVYENFYDEELAYMAWLTQTEQQ